MNDGGRKEAVRLCGLDCAFSTRQCHLQGNRNWLEDMLDVTMMCAPLKDHIT